MIYRKASRMVKEKISENKREPNVNLTFKNETNTKNIEEFGVENKPYFFET